MMITEDGSQKESNIDATFSGEEHMDSGFGREVYKFSVDFVLNADGRN